MDEARWNFLMGDAEDAGLTKSEMREGWHYCPDFDYLLCQFGVTPVLKTCVCTPWTEDQIEQFGDDDAAIADQRKEG